LTPGLAGGRVITYQNDEKASENGQYDSHFQNTVLD